MTPAAQITGVPGAGSNAAPTAGASPRKLKPASANAAASLLANVNWTEAAVGVPPVLSQAELLALQMERQLC